MLSVEVHPTNPITTTTRTLPLPAGLASDEVLIEVHAAASNPKDWLHLVARNESSNSGDDLAGTIKAVGSSVTRYAVGDRVAALHPLGKPFGAYAEYATAPAHTVLKVPDSLSFEEASTIPLVSMTAALTLFRRQKFVAPWHKKLPEENRKPLLIYGATTALGTYTIKLAKLSGIGPIIAVGGKSSEYIKTLLRDDDIFLDYRSGIPEITKSVRDFVEQQHLRLSNAIDTINEDGSWIKVSQMLDGGYLSVFSGSKTYNEAGVPSNVNIVYTFVGSAHEGSYRPSMPKQPPPEDVRNDIGFASEFFRWLEGLLTRGEYSGHPYEIIPGGLEGVAEGLNRLREGRSNGKKFVYQIRTGREDTVQTDA